MHYVFLGSLSSCWSSQPQTKKVSREIAEFRASGVHMAESRELRSRGEGMHVEVDVGLGAPCGHLT